MTELHELSLAVMADAKRIDEALRTCDDGNEGGYYYEGWTDESMYVDEVLMRLFIAFEDDHENAYAHFVASPTAHFARTFYDAHVGFYAVCAACGP